MQRNTIALLDIDLHLFDGTAGGAGAAGAADGGVPGTGTQQEGAGTLPKADLKRNGSSRRSKKGEFDNVVFGKQDAAEPVTTSPAAGENKGEGNANKSGVQITSDSREAKRQAFKELIEGEYKNEFTETFQTAFDRRFKDTKSMEKSLNDQKPILDMLMQRYGIADGNMAKLQEAIEKDTAYWEDAAEEAGLTVEQFMAMKKLERENAEMKALRQRQQGQEMAQQQMSKWMVEAEKVKEVYPSFDFRTEAANREFLGLLKSGLPVQKAYEVIHMDEIKENAARVAAQTAGQQMVANLQKKQSRPMENGTSSQSAVITKSDVHSLTKKERAEAARRAERGVIQRF